MMELQRTRQPTSNLFQMLIANANGHFDQMMNPEKSMLQQSEPTTKRSKSQSEPEGICIRLWNFGLEMNQL